MKKGIVLIGLVIFCFIGGKSYAQNAHPDTVYTGIYVTSIHNIDFRQKEYTINFWLWMKYKNKAFDFLRNLEVPQSKTCVISDSTTQFDSASGRIYVLMQLQCVMKDSWRIGNFPFDRQNLRLSLENSQYDSSALVFAKDTVGKWYDRFTLSGWNINPDSSTIKIGKRVYETTFGDPQMTKPRAVYSTYRVKIGLTREGMGLFWKMFIGMYIAFLIAYICFFIHADSIDSRFGLSVGALFAVMANKYIIDSSLPESSSFTLVDTLHGLTLAFIFAVVTCTAYSLKLVKENSLKKANRFDMISGQILLFLYIILNFYFISKASKG
jgi:hypothetical protein